MSDIIYDDAFVRRLISDYMDKLFYFCLKKTGDQYEAENLAADIVLNVLSSHERWPATVNFSAWFWQIARNRYSVWVRKKDEHDKWISEFDVSEYEITDENAVLDELLQKENIELLRRELAFISSSYREILVAYYIEDKSVKEIATALGISESLVKTNLFRARKALKEGMEMARTFGPRSYNPGEVEFVIFGNKTIMLHPYVNRLVPQNILLEAYENPCTIEEFAVALGVAVPYLEEEVNTLTDRGFLRKSGDKYFTEFFIISKESQYEIYNIQNRNIREISFGIDTIVSDLLSEIRKLGTITQKVKDSDFKWLCVLYTFDALLEFHIEIERYFSESENFIIGYEKTNIPEIPMGYRRSYTEDGEFFRFNVCNYGFEKNELNLFAAEYSLIADMVRENRSVSSLSNPEKNMWNRSINNVFAYEEEDGTITTNIFAINEENKNKLDIMIKTHPLAEKVINILSDIMKKSIDTLVRSCPPCFRDKCKAYALSHMRRIFTMLINEEVESGGLIIPEDPATSTVCIYLIIK